MEKKGCIRRFNMFTTGGENDKDVHTKIQLILYYAESRFWCILTNLTKADKKSLSSCQILLQRELVSLYWLFLMLYGLTRLVVNSYSFYHTLESGLVPERLFKCLY